MKWFGIVGMCVLVFGTIFANADLNMNVYYPANTTYTDATDIPLIFNTINENVTTVNCSATVNTVSILGTTAMTNNTNYSSTFALTSNGFKTLNVSCVDNESITNNTLQYFTVTDTYIPTISDNPLDIGKAFIDLIVGLAYAVVVFAGIIGLLLIVKYVKQMK